MIGKQLYSKWMSAWNDDLTVVEQITAKDCIVHQARTDARSSLETKGIEALKGIIKDGLALFDDAAMTIEVGPIEEKPYVTARWKFTGDYKGGLPGAKVAPGTTISFQGTDIFLIEEDKIKEYWVSSDGLYLMEQLGVFDK